MRNLKKVLSLVLAMAMMLSVMVVGAGASYTDVDDIENLDAVYTLTALGIVEGRETGEFEPGDTLTRAEAAKLVAILNLATNPVPNANGKSSFVDVVNTPNVAWANDFIEYGVAQGSIAGVGDDRFAPNSEVTGVQLAKMLLGILGWKADVEGYVGANWEYNVNIDASTANLYKGLENIDPTAPITRDDAAQMLYNALQANMVVYLTESAGALDVLSKKLWEEKYPFVEVYEGVLAEMEYDVEDGEYTYEVNGDGEGDLPATATDYTDLFGYNVIYFTDVVAGEKVLLGMYDYYNTVETGLYGDYEAADEDDVDEWPAELLFAADDNYINLNQLDDAAFHDYYTYKAIDNDDVAGYDIMIVYPVYDEVVDVVTKDGIKTKEAAGADLYEDSTIEAGLVKGDNVAIEEDTTLKTDWIISKLADEKGTVDHFTSKYNVITNMTVGSDEYAICSTRDHQNEVYPELAGKKVTFNVINGYAVNVAIDDSIALSELLLVTNLEEGYDEDYTYDAYAMFSDGEIKAIDISKLNGSWTNITEIAKHLENTSEKYGYLAKYDEVSGAYELTSMDKVPSPAALGFDNVDPIFDATFSPATYGDDDAGIMVGDEKIEFANDAIIYLADVSGKETVYSVATGADMQTLTGENVVYYAGINEAANGHDYVTFAFIKTDSISESADNFGILTSDVVWYDYNDKGVDYATFTIWNGTEEVSITAEVGEMVESFEYHEGDVIVYRTNDGKIINMTLTTGVVDSITAYDADDYNALVYTEGTPAGLDFSEALVIGAAEGVKADLIPATLKLDGVTLIDNIYYVTVDGVVELVIVDAEGVEIHTCNQ